VAAEIRQYGAKPSVEGVSHFVEVVAACAEPVEEQERRPTRSPFLDRELHSLHHDAAVARVLFFPLAPGPGLSHVGACVAVADELERRGHETVLAYGGSKPELVSGWTRRLERVEEIPYERTVGDSAAGWYEPGDLERLTRGDLELIERVRPDVAVVDLRTSASMACEVSGVPDLSLMHFLRLTAWYREPDPWRLRARELRRPQRLPHAFRRWLDRDPGGGKTLRAALGAARVSLGLPGTGSPWEGRLVACTTTPWLDPAELPPNWRYVGPISWSAGRIGPEPHRGSRPLVVAVESTTGPSPLLPRVLRELADEPVDLVAAAAGRESIDDLGLLAPRARIERLLPTTAWLEAADVAIVEGGHQTACVAQRAGTPLIVVPHRADQWAWADRVERLGSGVAVRQPVAPGAVRRAVSRVLRDERYRQAAERVGAHLQEWDGARATADLVEGLVAS
jgi:UDP:flavonoid glycosyltransferase YjiC (YdhE family)